MIIRHPPGRRAGGRSDARTQTAAAPVVQSVAALTVGFTQTGAPGLVQENYSKLD